MVTDYEYDPEKEIVKICEENKILFTNLDEFTGLRVSGLLNLVHHNLSKFLQKKNKNGNYILSINNPINKTEYPLQIRYEGNKEEPKEENTKTITLMSKFSPVPYAKLLLNSTEFIYDSRKQFWRYDKKEGIWEKDAEQYIRTKLRKSLMGDEQQKKYYADEVISYIQDISYKENFVFKKNPYIIAFKNMLFDLKTDTFVSFSPEYYITNKINIDITDIKDCPNIDKFFTDCLDEEHKEILYDLSAYTLFTEYPIQKLFFIYGYPDTGKSQFLKLLEIFLGKENCSMVEPKAIQLDKHCMYKMWLKLANIVSDINYDEFENVNQIKKLTGGDSVDIRPMYQEGFSEVLYAKQIYSTNKLPSVKEKTVAWYRRLYLIKFLNIVKPEKKDLFLMEKLTTEKELQGFAFQCLNHLRVLYKNKFVFTYEMDESKLPGLYEKLSNPNLMFIEENCVEGRENWCFKYEFEERLNNWLKAHHFPPMTKSEINRYMNEHYNESNRPAPSWASGDFENKTYRVWVGLRWKTLEDSNFTTFTNLTSISKEYIYNRSVLKTPVNPLNSYKKLEKNEKIDQNLTSLTEKDENSVKDEKIESKESNNYKESIKYKVLEFIPEFVKSDETIEKNHNPGEIIELPEDIAKILLEDKKIETFKYYK